jgi:hypothetical protein
MVTTMQRAPATESGTASSLIASDRVEGTEVYDPHGKRIGKVERLVIDKAGGRIASVDPLSDSLADAEL